MRMLTLAASFVVTLGFATAPAWADPAGVLRCNVKGGFGFLIAGDRAATCVYRQPGRPTEFYRGHMSDVGFDLGPTNAFVVAYRVPGQPLTPGALQGSYVGPGGSLIGSTGSRAALLQGSHATLIQIPNSAVNANTGLNVSVAVNKLDLEFAGFETMSDRRRIEILRSYGIHDER